MDQYSTGKIIKKYREKNGLTQEELALRLGVSSKAVSKWETGKGFPDVTLFDEISSVLSFSISELITGEIISNTNISANPSKAKIYVCPICGNVMVSIGEASVSCHGIKLAPLEAEEIDDAHSIELEDIEEDYYLTIDHEMSKKHYISFVIVIKSDSISIIKLYPEQNAEVRFPKRGTMGIYLYCNNDGLFKRRIR